MDERTRAHIDLLNEFDSICARNQLKYTLTDKNLINLCDEGHLAEEVLYVTVAMTGGDIERLVDIVNDRIDGRFVETFVNNPNGRAIHVRYCNSNTTRINLGNYHYHVNHGLYIRIVEIAREPEKRPDKYIALATAWKKSCMEEREYTAKEKALISTVNTAKKMFGRNKAAEMLYNYRSKFYKIDKWDDISGTNTIRIGKLTMRGNSLGEIERINTEDGEFSICRNLNGFRVAKGFTNRGIQNQEIWDLDTPFEEVMTGEFMEHINAARLARETYMVIKDREKASGVVKSKGWNTYLMARNLIKQREIFTEEKLSELEAALDNNNIDLFDEAIIEYEIQKNKYLKKDVPFIGVEGLERLIEKRNALNN